jgi:proteasome accessory factor B
MRPEFLENSGHNLWNSQSDLFAICIAEQALAQYAGTPIHDRLESVFDRIRQSLPAAVVVRSPALAESIGFQPRPVTEIDPRIWDTVVGALERRLRLRIVYRVIRVDSVTIRSVDPVRLVNREGEWYLLAWDRDRRGFRTFAMGRVAEVVELDEPVSVPSEIDVETFVRQGFGGFWGTERYTVRVCFERSVAPYIEERTWHPTQRIVAYRKGGIVLTMKTSHLDGVKRWLLSFGSVAKALAPKELVAAMRSVTETMAGMYSRDDRKTITGSNAEVKP